MWDTDLTGGVALVFGAEGKGLRPLVRAELRRARLDPLAGAVESLNVSVAAALLLYEARRQRSGPDGRPDALPLRRLQPPTRRAVHDATRAGRHAGEFRRAEGCSRGRRLRRRRRRRRARAARRCGSRPTPTRCSSASRPSTAIASRWSSSPRTRPCIGTAGREVGEALVADLLPRSRRRRAAASDRPAGSPTSSTRDDRARLERLRRGE